MCSRAVQNSHSRRRHLHHRRPRHPLAQMQKPGIMVVDRIGEQQGWAATAHVSHSPIQRAIGAGSSQRTLMAITTARAGHPEGVEPCAPPWVAPSVVQSGPRFSYASRTRAAKGQDIGKAYLHFLEDTEEHRFSRMCLNRICVSLWISVSSEECRARFARAQ